MDLGAIGQLVLSQVDDPAGMGFTAAARPNITPPEILAAVNEGQQLAALLTLCLETTAAFPLTANTCWYLPRPVLTDLIAPLRFVLGGVRLRPSVLADLDARDSLWQASSGSPARYALLGFNLMAVTPQPASDVTAQMTYAQSPPALVNDADTPAIPEAYHQNLVDYAVYRVRLKEGAQGLERGLKRLNLFLDDMTRLGNYVRERSVAARYDVEPFELQLFDRSRMIDEVMKGRMGQQGRPSPHP
jgi:hypothetical protein